MSLYIKCVNINMIGDEEIEEPQTRVFNVADIDATELSDKVNIGGNQYIGEVLKDEYIGIDVNLPNYLFMPEKMEGVLWYELRTNTFISYSDMFNRVRYQYCIHIVYKVIIEEFIEDPPFFYKEGFKYAKVRYELFHIMPEMKIYSKKQKKFVHEHSYIMEKLKK